jgi:chromosome segregation and condensation protein ScpB
VKTALLKDAVRASLQILFVEGSLSVDLLRGRLRDVFASDPSENFRPIASIPAAELIAGLLDANKKLEPLGFQVKILNGEVSLFAGPVESPRLQSYLREKTDCSGNPEMTPARMEVLGCIALKQPISLAEIDRLFSAEKRSVVTSLLEAGWIEGRGGPGGRIFFVVTTKFLQRFGFASIEEMRASLG